MDGVRPQPGTARGAGITLGTVTGGALGLWCSYHILSPAQAFGILDDRLAAVGPDALLRRVWLLGSCLTGFSALAGGLIAAGLAAGMADYARLRRGLAACHIHVFTTYDRYGGTGAGGHVGVSTPSPPPHSVV